MTVPTLTFNNTRGIAEISRYILHFAGVEFKDERVDSFSKEILDQYPISDLVLYKDSDIELYNHSTIARYLARKYQLIGKSEIEQLYSHEVFDSTRDILCFLYLSAKSDTQKEKMKTVYIPRFLGAYEKKLSLPNHVYVAGGDSITWADLAIASAVDTLRLAGYSEEIKNYPRVEQLVTIVQSNQNINKYKIVVLVEIIDFNYNLLKTFTDTTSPFCVEPSEDNEWMYN
eukprot:gene7650-9409_t